MSFKKYLTELANIEVGQAIQAHEPSEEASSSVLAPRIFTEINHRLIVELNEVILSPEQGIQKVRKVMHRYALDMPVLYDLDPMGDEYIIELKQFGQAHGATIFGDYTTGTEVINTNPDAYLYFIYYLTDDGHYDFHAEMIREDDIDEILSDDEDDEEELE